MNNLTTRKIVLGMLLALVLAFSVQGTAEAITKFTKTSSTDNQIVSIQQPFTIRFSVSLQDKQRIPDVAGTGYVDQESAAIDKDGYFLDSNRFYKNAAEQPIDAQGYFRNADGNRYNANEDAIDPQGYLLNADGTHTTDPKTKATVGTNPTTQLKAVDTVRTKTTPLNQYHYNEQSISITPAPNTITFTKGSTKVTSLSQDAEESDERLSSPISLSGRASVAGVYIITIADTSESGDTPDGYTAATSITFTITVLQAAETTRALTVTSGLSDGIVREFGTKELSVTVSGTTANARVEFEITKGSGSLSAENTVGSKTSKRLSTLTNSSGIATVTLDPKKGTNHVRAWIFGNSPGTENKSTEGIYIYRWASLNKVSGDAGDSGDPQQNQKGPVSSRLGKPFVVQLFDSTGRTTIPGAEIDFTSGNGGTLSYDPSTPTNLRGELLDSDAATVKTVKTDSNGKASIFLVLGVLAGEGYTVTARYGPLVTSFDTQKFTATSLADTVTSKATSITKVAETDGQSADEYGFLKKPLTVVVRDQGRQRLAHINGTSVIVRFLTLNGGDLTAPADSEPGTLSTESDALDTDGAKDITTDANGEASVIYTAPEEGGRRTVRASINNGLKSVVFTINGTPSSGGGGGGGGGGDVDEDDEDEDDITNTITVSPLTLSGAPGAVVQLGVLAGTTAVPVTVTGNAAFIAAGGLVSETTAIRDVTLPNTAGSTYSLTVSARGYDNRPITVTVTATAPVSTALGTLTVSRSGAPVGTQQQIIVRASPAPSSDLPFTITRDGIRVGGGEITTAGLGRAIVTVPTTGSYVLSIKAVGYMTEQVTLTSTGQTVPTPTPIPTPTPTPTPTVVAEPSSIQISGPAARSGTVNQQLDAPLLVRVLDDVGTGVADARVIFRVISGRGKLSERGNGRAVGVQTDSSGYARANFTPTDDGTITVRASATGVTAAVTFTISTGSVAPTGTPGTTTPRTTTSRAPVVHVTAASRPPMLWVDGGAIYALVGASPQRFAASVDNALNIAIGGGKVYWTEKTGESGGTINSANLNGSGVTELVSILAVPMGIAVDTAGSKLYWTNSRGRIQSADLDGSGITNVMQNLPSPMDLALAGGNAYWTQGNGSVRFVNLRGQKVVRNVSTGTDTPGSLVIGGGKVYWTETTGESGGTVNSANLNGTGATQLASILAAPMGIAVDGSRSKLYWTNSRGRIQSANLDGSGIKNVVSGLGSPGDMVLSNSITAPAGAGSLAGSGTTTASNAKYDVNGDGVVDRFDALLVVSAFGTSNNKYDVNGDGTVNVKDYDLVFDNLAPGAAAAPAIVGMKFSAVQIERIEEQIDLLIATNDRSPATLRTLIYLQQLLVTARPEKTQLLANYPNPFNPETWIPYELATDTNVRITIYNTQGVVIRSLQFGHQSAGYYTGRDRAAYWDGRNALGEQVASGLYFYQLETDEMSLMRKMVILK